jgi:hypothetical protein
MATQKELQTAAGAGREGGVFRERALELLGERRILVQHALRDLFCDLGFHVFFLLKAGIEEAPGCKGIGSLRFEQRQYQTGQALSHRDHQRTGQ